MKTTRGCNVKKRCIRCLGPKMFEWNEAHNIYRLTKHETGGGGREAKEPLAQVGGTIYGGGARKAHLG